MKWLLIGGGLFTAVVVIAVITGYLLPKGHVVTRTATYRAAPAELWATITAFADAAQWREDVARVEMLPPAEGKTRWRETGKHGATVYELVEAHAPDRVVTRIAEEGPFSGSWTIELAAVEGGTRASITERGEVYNPIFRLMSRFVFGHTATIDGYLTALGKKHGETITPIQ